MPRFRDSKVYKLCLFLSIRNGFFYCISILFLVCSVSSGLVSAQPSAINKDLSHLKNKEHPFTPGVMIIKFKKDSPLRLGAEELFKSGQLFQSRVDSDAFDLLNQKFSLSKIEIINPKVDLDQIRAKFSKRSKRIPKSVLENPIEWEPIYKFEFNQKEIDMKEVCRLYTLNEHVEYAHPNYYVTND